MLRPDGLPIKLATLNQTLVMGVLNVTPDSFSDGGKFAASDTAIAHGEKMFSEGADIIDVGGESTRPGANRISIQEELDRVIPVVSELAQLGIATSIDTMRAQVANEAIQAGACLVNDVSGGKADPEMFTVMSNNKLPFVMMHWRGHSTEMMSLTNYDDVVADVCDELQAQVNNAVAAGIDLGRIAIDPGIGFAKTVDQNWPILAQIDELQNLGLPILIGASRKKFLGDLLAKDGKPRDVDGREMATVAITTLMAYQSIWAVRVHDVKASRDAINVVARIHAEQGNG